MCVLRHLMQSLGAIVSQTSSSANFASALIVLVNCHLNCTLKTFQKPRSSSLVRSFWQITPLVVTEKWLVKQETENSINRTGYTCPRFT